MGTANAFHMLVLPILQCMALIFASFAAIRLIQIACDALIEIGLHREPERVVKRLPYSPRYRMVSTRADRP